MDLKVEFLVGKQQKNNWSGVFGYKPDDIEVYENLGEIYAVLRLATEVENIELETVAGLLLDGLQESYFDSVKKEEDLMIRLEDAMWDLKSRLETVISRESQVMEKGLDMEAAVVVFHENVVYVSIVGESKIFLNRLDKTVDISGALIDANMMGFLKSGSLELEEGDRFGLATSKTLEEEGVELVNNSINSLNITLLDKLSEKQGIAMLIIASSNDTWFDPKLEVHEPESLQEVVQEESTAGVLAPFEDEEVLEESKEELLEEIVDDSVKERALSEKEPILMDATQQVSAQTSLLEIGKANLAKLKSKASSVLTFAKVKGKTAYTNLKTRSANVGDAKPSTKTYPPGFMKEDEEELDTIQEEPIKTPFLTNANLKASDLKQKLFSNNKTYAKILRDIGSFFQNIFQNIYAVFKKEIIGTGDRRDAYLKGKRLKRNRQIFVVATLVIAVVLFLVIRNAENTRKFNNQVAEKKQQVKEVTINVDSLIPQVQETKSQAEDKKALLINEMDSLALSIERLQKDNFINANKEVFTKEINDLNNSIVKIQTGKDNLLFIQAFSEPQVITDVGKSYAESNLTDIEYSNGYIYISDAGMNVIYRVNPTQLNSQPETYVSGLQTPRLLVRNVAGEIVFYDSDTTSSVGAIDINQANTIYRYPALSESNIGSVKEVAIYDGNDALYEIHQNHQQIFKRTRVGSDYEGGGSFFNPESTTSWKSDPELGSAIDVSAPYELYVLLEGKGFRRYLGGEENTLSYNTFTNLSQTDFNALSNAVAFDIEGASFAVADPTSKRVLLFEISPDGEKKINFVKQYVYRGSDDVFSQISEVVVDDVNKRIYVLDSNRVIRLDI